MFCRSFANTIRLAPFSFDDMLTALSHERPMTLTTELYSRLLAVAGLDQRGVPWAPLLKKVLKGMEQFAAVVDHMDEGGFLALSPVERVAVAAFLAMRCAMSESVRDAVEKNMEKMEDARRSAREQVRKRVNKCRCNGLNHVRCVTG